VGEDEMGRSTLRRRGSVDREWKCLGKITIAAPPWEVRKRGSGQPEGGGEKDKKTEPPPLGRGRSKRHLAAMVAEEDWKGKSSSSGSSRRSSKGEDERRRLGCRITMNPIDNRCRRDYLPCAREDGKREVKRVQETTWTARQRKSRTCPNK